MRKIIFLVLALCAGAPKLFAAGDKDSIQQEMLTMMARIDSVNNAMKYESGIVFLSEGANKGFATLKIPAGFKFLNAEQSQYVLTEVWGNPARPDVLGMVFPANGAPYADSSYAYVISWEEAGYVKDEDANEINYSDLLKEIQKDEEETNKNRVKEGYETVHILRWAQQPFYDNNRKVLHWAKELQFGDDGVEHTLNYDIRVLGRKGILSMNAVAGISGLPQVKEDIDKILAMAEFTAGNKYTDFNESTDNIAAYTIGGLVAGKLLMKAGLWVAILKFWKLIAAGIVAAFYGVKKFLAGRKQKDTQGDEG